ncbi:hypothetical protein E2562_025044 [Oryza meyeriana var. granulata]|uniref:Uncharacterized protein n=1 Tax=Oryza meyeriana var. granulata TaxID=110450 RepID=A0A6G1D9B8_9ORYZ|nr:hypothetical protein E2562_025044 [Oryza meyeriana var. granulata]
MLFCGTGSFKDVDKDAGGGGKAAAPEAAARKKKQAGESRREKILRRVGGGATGEGGGGGGGHVLVRFVQSEEKGWVPIVVKLPPEEEQQQKQRTGCKKRKQAASTTSSSQSSTPPTSEPASPREDVKVAHAAAAAKAPAAAVVPAKRKAAGEMWSLSWGKNVRPRHYMPFVSVLLLASLVVFGRVFAICCTSVWWYLVPILTSPNGGGEAHGAVRRATGKVLAKKASDKKIAGEKPVAPLLAPSHGKKGSSGVQELISPRSHPHGKKG